MITEFISALAVLTILTVIKAPYGKYSKKSWGVRINSKYAWLIMELPAVLVIALIFFLNLKTATIVSIVFLILWELHYIYRTFFFSMLIRGAKKTFPILLLVFAMLFNSMNGFIMGYYLFVLKPENNISWLYSIPFIIGTILFLGGFILHVYSDRIIRNLRQPGENTYKIPKGGLFRYVTNPNYLGEMIQWSGWAVLTFSLPGLAFAFFTFANLAPRAIENHRWYQEQFRDYPKKRKILIPHIF
ncbi:MAG: DUF1295 domain-containing protein [bacterium]|nr:DUF1295 domain-containing protein [bacterium]